MVYLLAIILAVSCQQKKRGVVCSRVDAQSGQCVAELTEVSETKDPPPADEIKKPNIQSPEEIVAGPDKKLLKNYKINSRCLDNKCSTDFTCTVFGCSDSGFVDLLRFTDAGQSDSADLCEKDGISVDSGQTLTCGFLNASADGFIDDQKVTIPVTDNLLNNGTCLAYDVPEGEIASTNVRVKDDGCESKVANRYATRVIELTFPPVAQ